MNVDVVVIGAGVVGAACAYSAVRAGLTVCVVDRGPVAGGTTGAGEGNLLVSDKEPGPELDLALLSNRVWSEFGALPLAGATLAEHVEMEEKGGLVVTSSADAMSALDRLAATQRGNGIEASRIADDQLHDHEPNIAPGLAGGYLYPQDM